MKYYLEVIGVWILISLFIAGMMENIFWGMIITTGIFLFAKYGGVKIFEK